ncbi:uncharacterized protein SCHCODRAFT_02519679 [Schizophyllum commune H4-8]|nr:uncharacterized protein SCHCODRAFT_02519679 [Schizophyllum commune H4-8]KAI5885542.1 hypothetical protein SCHCODRAFT_02519679 [Schizophyllum commune H4-8]
MHAIQAQSQEIVLSAAGTFGSQVVDKRRIQSLQHETTDKTVPGRVHEAVPVAPAHGPLIDVHISRNKAWSALCQHSHRQPPIVNVTLTFIVYRRFLRSTRSHPAIHSATSLDPVYHFSPLTLFRTMQFSLTHLFLVLSAVAAMAAATESMKIPENKNATMNVQKMQKNPTVHQVN